MRIIGIGVCGPGEADKYLQGTLDEFKRLCDDVLIATNNATQKEIKLLDKYGFNHYEDNREWGIDQPNIKTDLLTKAGELNPDWIIALDMDEQFAPEFTREVAESLASKGEIAYHFLVINLYNNEKTYAHGEGIQRFWNVRFYKYLPKYGLQFQRKNLHCGLGPPLMYMYGWYAPFYLLHYGLMKPQDRQSRIERYKKYDPNRRFKSGAYYDDLGREMTEYPFIPGRILEQIRNVQEGRPRTTPARVMRIYNNIEPNI